MNPEPTQPVRPSAGKKSPYSPPRPPAVHSGTLCKTDMAASCARTLAKVGLSVLESPAVRRPGISSYPAGNIKSRVFGRAYGTGLPPAVRGGRVLGCASLLGAALGFYQTLKFGVHRHLAQEESEVRPKQIDPFWVTWFSLNLFLCVVVDGGSRDVKCRWLHSHLRSKGKRLMIH